MMLDRLKKRRKAISVVMRAYANVARIPEPLVLLRRYVDLLIEKEEADIQRDMETPEDAGLIHQCVGMDKCSWCLDRARVSNWIQYDLHMQKRKGITLSGWIAQQNRIL